MHTAAFAAAGLLGTYQARDIAPDQLEGALEGIRQADVLGCNLSLPHKETVLGMLDHVSKQAGQIGAVNTVIQKDGRLYGENTDAPGLMASLLESGYTPAQQSGGVALVLGAGGAARAAVYALERAGCEVWIWNRNLERAQHLLAELCPSGRVWEQQEHIPFAEVGLLLNASSAGLNNPLESPLHIPFPDLASDALVYDMVYKPLETALLKSARAAGFHSTHGLGMLAHQAQLAFTAWTGKEVSSHVFLQAALDVLDPALETSQNSEAGSSEAGEPG